eukprot:CAMPEP_0118979332 /NCGR_PEP_ID=MMETSP1173-20130426/25730_1 /TAXON_ID=1034831 /ORGANISM="Rhizochromulina marina cf, Strain CCMP1243" /LENGTH=451 /DNA_ID=CAMNT_0006929589 /DNA_START=1 /DNA_END=1353 /DNA_ORIENTATION=+
MRVNSVGAVRNATCDGGIGSSGYYVFSSGEPREDPPPCRFPFAPASLALSRHFEGDDDATCSITYAELVYPIHLASCCMYTVTSWALAALLVSWALRTPRKRTLQQRRDGLLPRRVYICGALCLCFNGLSALDLKGWANRYGDSGVILDQVLADIATGFLHCGLFFFVTVKLKAIISMPILGAASFLTEDFLNALLLVSCVTALVSGVILGVLQWTTSGHFAANNTVMSNLKNAIFGALQLVYACLCGYRVALIGYHMRKSGLSFSWDITAEQQRTVRIFFVISFLILFAGGYNVARALERSAQIQYRQPPCTVWKALYFETQLAILLACALFLAAAWPRTGCVSRESVATGEPLGNPRRTDWSTTETGPSLRWFRLKTISRSGKNPSTAALVLGLPPWPSNASSNNKSALGNREEPSSSHSSSSSAGPAGSGSSEWSVTNPLAPRPSSEG